MLDIRNGKSCASQKRAGLSENPDVFTGSPPPNRGTCGISPVGAENPPVRIGTLQVTRY